jgi:outer membrane lipoprotein SlyB
MEKWGLTEIETEMMGILLFSEFIFSVFHIHNRMGFGNIFGRAIGSIASKILPIKNVDGGELGDVIGGVAGSIAGFKTGGAVKGKKGSRQVILAHGGEYILPANAKPTKAQKAVVARNKRKAKK